VDRDQCWDAPNEEIDFVFMSAKTIYHDVEEYLVSSLKQEVLHNFVKLLASNYTKYFSSGLWL